MKNRSGYAKTAFGCVIIWALGLFWMWFDFNYGSHVWTIGAGQALIAITMMIAALVFVVCVIAMVWRKLRGA